MNKYRTIYTVTIFFIITSVLATSLFAQTQPKFVLTPLTNTTTSIALDETQVLQYQVSNATKITRTLTMTPMQGITQLSGEGLCPNPFTLAHNQSCILSLSLAGHALPVKTTTGPELCATDGSDNTAPDPFLCSQPSLADSLNITVVPVKKATLFVEPAFFVLTPLQASKSFTVTNTSTQLTARNIVANLVGTALDGRVTQDASGCKQVLPSQSCVLTFTSEGTDVTLTRFPIQGENTLPTGAAIAIASASKAPISVLGTPLILDINQTGILTITNHSPSITATNIKAYSVPESITQDATNCATVAPGNTCTLTFKSSETAVNTSIMPIYGDQTSYTEASISVNTAPLKTIAFVGSSSLTLTANGTSTGTMSVQNLSGQTIASGLTAHFEATNLNGIVTATSCGELANNEICTITFTANRTNITATSFPIYGPNTISLDGSITIIAAPEAYLTSSVNNNLYQCMIDSTSKNFTQCQTFSNLGLNLPHDIVINPSKTRAYIANYGNDSISVCDIDPSNFNLINCTSALANGLNSLYGFTLNPAGTIAYIPNASGNQVSQCPINASTGKFDNACTLTNATLLNTPRGIVINPANTLAYIANLNGQNIIQCSVDGTTGDLSACAVAYTPTTTQQFSGITIDTSGNRLYMSASNASNQTVCPITFVGCATTLFSSTNTSAAGIAINTAGTIDYIANTGTSNEYTQFSLTDGFISSFASYSTLPSNIWGIALLE